MLKVGAYLAALAKTKDKKFISESSFIDLNSLRKIKECKEQRHRAKDKFLEQCEYNRIYKDSLTKEQYWMYEIMEKMDSFSGSNNEKLSTQRKLDKLAVNLMMNQLQ